MWNRLTVKAEVYRLWSPAFLGCAAFGPDEIAIMTVRLDLRNVSGQNNVVAESLAQTIWVLAKTREPLINLRIMAHCAFDSRATVWTGS